jgi:hypothetical protein
MPLECEEVQSYAQFFTLTVTTGRKTTPWMEGQILALHLKLCLK